ncbi:MAG: phage minor head protein, partial [Betaproteobacteria bacterium]
TCWTNPVPDIRLGGRPFDQQVRFFSAKVNVPTVRYDDLWRSDHSHGFMVAGAHRAALLDDLRLAVDKAVRDGETLTQFRARFDDIVLKHGWTGWTGSESAAGRARRTRVIYDTNVRQSYNAGRYAQLTSPAMIKARPYWQYRHNDIGISKFPRVQHMAWNGLILRYDDPFWRTHFPQNGWLCKCGVRALSADDVKRLGKPVGGAPQGTEGIDPGFDYNPGDAARSLPAANAFAERVATMPPKWRDIALRDAQQRVGDYFAEASALVRRSLTARVESPIPVGLLSPSAAASAPGSLLVALDGTATQQLVTAGVPATFLADIAAQLTRPSAVLRNTIDGTLVYVWIQDDGRYVQLVLDSRTRTAAPKISASMIRSGGLVSRSTLAASRYTVLEGSL